MASLMIHLAVTNLVIEELGLTDVDRIRFGCILPDGAKEKRKGHLKKDEDGFTYIDLNEFCSRFKEEMKNDGLYLGYFMHLLEDTLFRRMLYTRLNYVRTDENVSRLYNDYSVLNSYLANKYNITIDMIKGIDIEGEPINQIGEFNQEGIVEEARRGFIESESKELQFFREEDINRYIEEAKEECIKVIKKLREENKGIDNSEYKWKKQQ